MPWFPRLLSRPLTAGPAQRYPEDVETENEAEEPRADDQPADIETPDPAGTHTALPPKLEKWRKRSATGAILTGFALGLQEALEHREQEPSIVVQTSGDPPRDLPVEADLESGRPRQSVVSIRPWLLPDGEGQRDARGGDEAQDGPGRPSDS